MVAHVWACEGARVVVSDVNVAGGEEAASLVCKQCGEAIFVAANVGFAQESRALVDQTRTMVAWMWPATMPELAGHLRQPLTIRWMVGSR